MSTPLVSIVIDNFNYARFLPDAIDSALRQTWPAVEVVVADDGSTDGSPEVIAGYGDRVRAVLKENGGQASAFNAGFDATSGDIVVFLDSDDVLHPDFAERAVRAFERSPEAAVVQFRMRTVDAGLVPLGPTVPPEYVTLASGRVGDRVRSWTAGSNFAPNGAAAFPRRTLETLFPLAEEELWQGADFFMLRGAALLGPVAAVDETAVDYRSHGSNDSNLAELDLAGVRRALDRQLRYGRLLGDLAERLGGPPVLDPLRAPDPLFLTQRIVSRRLAPQEHPVAGDTTPRLALAGIRAVSAREDLRRPLKLMHAGWFALMALAPRPLARRLATRLMLPLSRLRPDGEGRRSLPARLLERMLRR